LDELISGMFLINVALMTYLDFFVKVAGKTGPADQGLVYIPTGSIGVFVGRAIYLATVLHLPAFDLGPDGGMEVQIPSAYFIRYLGEIQHRSGNVSGHPETYTDKEEKDRGQAGGKNDPIRLRNEAKDRRNPATQQ